MKKIPAIKSVMTAFPYWIDAEESMLTAEKMMAEHDISHLPVKQQGELVGVIGHHDIEQAKSRVEENEKLISLKVADVCVFNVYKVSLEEPLDNVVLHMANFHIGSALVMKNDRLAGVFTMNDACRCLAEFLRYQFRPKNGDDVA